MIAQTGSGRKIKEWNNPATASHVLVVSVGQDAPSLATLKARWGDL